MRPLVVSLLMLSWSGLAGAQPLPSFLNGNDIERRLPSANLPVDAYRPNIPVMHVAPIAAGQPQALPLSSRFELRKVRFEGGTVFPLSDLREHYRPLIGRMVTLSELVAFTQRLTQRYQQDGYLLSYAYLPPQDFADGRVRVVLVEGYIRDYQIEGDIGPAATYLDTLMGKLKAERPLTRTTFERYTSLINRIPGVSFAAHLAAPASADGAARLVAQASRKPLSTAVQVGEGSRDDLQALIALTSNGQTRFAEQLSASVLVPPGEDDSRYGRLDYGQYLDGEGSRLLLSAARYRSEPSTRVRLDNGIDLSQQHETDRYSVGISQALIASPRQWLDVVGRFYVVKDRIDYQRAGSGLKSDSQTHLRALSFEGDWRQADPGRLRIVSAGVYQGLDYFGARTNADYDLDFLRLRLSALQSDQWFDNWQGVASAALSWSGDSLPESERVVFGGQSFGRGYPSDQAWGDKGWGVAYELNYSFKREGHWVNVLQPYVVLDAARTWFNEVDIREARLSSAALGVRLGDARYYNVALEVAKPLSDIALDSLDRRPRLTLSVSCHL